MIYAAMTDVVEVHSCGPGLIQLGEGENIVCIDPNDPFGGGHDGGGGPPGGGPAGNGKHPKPPPKTSGTLISLTSTNKIVKISWGQMRICGVSQIVNARPCVVRESVAGPPVLGWKTCRVARHPHWLVSEP